MLKNLLSLAIIGLTSCSLYAQDRMIITYDGSYSSTATSAVLDLYSTNQGFLAPRVTLTSTSDATTITGTEPNGLMVYNTATAGNVTPGFYYWEGSAWKRLLAGTTNLSGAGTLNYVPKWTPDGATLGNSQIFDDATNVGIGSSVPGQKLDVAGAIKLGTTTTTTAGTIRWNTTTNDFESFDGIRWWSLTGLHERTMNYTNDGF